ncbi:MAG: CHASE2 domain-containing protein [Raineya sp.]|jgi:CHASE2 domain-containing sensor protein|nr:CHASE2 domain-containing protein [Raineya sp.]
MQKTIIIIFIFIVHFSSCQAQNSAKKYEKIIIINDNKSSKQEIISIYQEIIKCNPKVIVLNFNFIHKGKQQDSLLNIFFEENPNILIPSHNLSDNEEYIVRQSKHFNYSGMESIGNYYAFDKDTIYRKFYPLSKARPDSLATEEEIYPTFAIAITLLYDKTQTIKFLDKHVHNMPIKIKYWGNEEQFYIYNKKDILSGNYPKDMLKDKIVMIGYLDPQGSTLHKTDSKKYPKMHFVTIDANIIRQILEDK